MNDNVIKNYEDEELHSDLALECISKINRIKQVIDDDTLGDKYAYEEILKIMEE